ncbi:MAG TPA: DUF131 domain-containing protein [Thermoplasmata archaeon]|nr:DUF131 domain-containing protein [Thermoplasmata archaeon]
MRPAQLLGPALLVAGLLTLALAISRGEATVYLIVIIPAVVGTGPLALLGILLVFAGFFLTFFLGFVGPAPPLASGPPIPATPTTPEATSPPAPTRRWGGVVFLGPFPLVFGSDPKMTRNMLLLGAVLFVALLALTIAFWLS